MNHPLPKVIEEGVIPEKGQLYDLHRFCKNAFNDKCIDHYKKIGDSDGFHQCPYGFTSFVVKGAQNKEILTSLNVDKVSNKRWVKKRLQKNESPNVLTKSQVEEIVADYHRYRAQNNYSKNIIRDIDTKKAKVDSKNELLDDTLHELRKMNKQLKSQAFFLNKKLEQDQFDQYEVRKIAKNIQSSVELVSVRLNAYDFTLNPGLVETGQMIPVNLYRKFEKARHCLSVYANSELVKVSFTGNCYDLIPSYEIVDILPYILVENGIKYSPPEGEVKCNFITEGSELVRIEVENEGPLLNPDEVPEITEKGKRGRAVTGKIKGTGKGLYVVKLICDYNNIGFSVESIRLNDDLGIFRAILDFKETKKANKSLISVSHF